MFTNIPTNWYCGAVLIAVTLQHKKQLNNLNKMNKKPLVRKTIFGTLFFLAFFSIHAQDRLFTYTYQSSVLNKGQREIEVWNTLRTGRNNYFARLDNRTEFEIGLGKNIQTAFYLNLTTKTKTVDNLGVKSFDNENEISFSNEWKYKILDPVANPFGLALYGEYGIGTSEYELEGKVIVDKKLEKFTLAGNGVYELEIVPSYDANALKWESEHKAELYASVAYEIKTGLNLTVESAFKNVFEEGELLHSALYAGIGISYVHDNFLLNFTVLPQIASFKGQTNSTLNLKEFEKVQCRLLFSYVL